MAMKTKEQVLHIGLQRGEELADHLDSIITYATAAKNRLSGGDVDKETLDYLSLVLGYVGDLHEPYDEISTEFDAEFPRKAPVKTKKKTRKARKG